MSICDGFDLAILLILSLGTWTGFFAGFWTLFSWWFAFFLGIWVVQCATPVILEVSQLQGRMAEGILALFLFILTILIISALGKRWRRAIHPFSFPLGNSLLGMVLGFTGSLLLLGVMAWGITLVEELRPLVAWSRSAKYFTAMAEQLPSITAFTELEKDLITHLQPENLPHTPSPPAPLPPPTTTYSKNNTATTTFYWTWQLPEDVEGNGVHKFLNLLDDQLQNWFFRGSPHAAQPLKSDHTLQLFGKFSPV